MRKRGGRPGPGISAFAPSYDPLDGNHAHYTLDLSHTATAGTDALDMARRMGDGLVHLHLCDGSGASTDEHLVPGRGTQPTVEVCEMLAAGDFSGHVILEVTTSGARTATEREALLDRVAAVRPRAPAALTDARTYMPGSTLFTDAMALTPAGDGVYDGELNEHWTIGRRRCTAARCWRCVRTRRAPSTAGSDVAADRGVRKLPVGARSRPDAGGDHGAQARPPGQPDRRRAEPGRPDCRPGGGDAGRPGAPRRRRCCRSIRSFR